MLQTLNTLAGKISPHSVTTNGNVIDDNSNKRGHKNNNNNNNSILVNNNNNNENANMNNFGKPDNSFVSSQFKRISGSEASSIDEPIK